MCVFLGTNKATTYSNFLLLRPFLGLSKSGLLVSNIECGKCPKISNTLFQTFFGPKFAFTAVVS